MLGFGNAQNPPEAGNPYAPRGEARSRNGTYAWIVKASAPIRYELVDLASHKILVTVDSYYPEPDPENIRYAEALGVFWNQSSDLVVLDELNRRRAGKTYLFAIQNGNAKQISLSRLISTPPSAAEVRLVVDRGWVTPTRIQVRLAMKNKDGSFGSKLYVIDLSNPDKPTAEPL
jgi:hypothetical protein